ncbi:MAG: VCBS repeat-containing protein [Lewinellaceae bacterium]|nr:VCBS repeat-containing protein [Lewinellaceae bacterium]
MKHFSLIHTLFLIGSLFLAGRPLFANAEAEAWPPAPPSYCPPHSDGPFFSWARDAISSGADEAEGVDIAMDDDGNYYVTGTFTGTMSFDAASTLTSAGMQDVFVAAFNCNGEFLWAYSLGEAYGDYGRAVAVEGNTLYLAGNIRDGDGDALVSLSNDPLVSPHSTAFPGHASGMGKLFLAAYTIDNVSSPGLTYQWGLLLHSTGLPTSLAVDSNGDIIMAGGVGDNCTFPGGSDDNGVELFPGSEITAYGTGYRNGFIAKYSPAGFPQWAHIIADGPGSTSNMVHDMVIDGTGNIYVTGSFTTTGSAEFNPGGVSMTLPVAGNHDAFIARYNPNGICEWAKSAGAENADEGLGIAVSDGLVFVTGYTQGTSGYYSAEHIQSSMPPPFPAQAGPYTLTNTSQPDYFIATYGTDGEWKDGQTNDLGGYTSRGTDIVTDENGRVYTTGFYHNALTAILGYDYDLTSGALTKVVDERYGVKLKGSDLIFHENALVTTGQFGGYSSPTTVDFDHGPDHDFNLTSSGRYNFFLAKYSLGTYTVATTDETCIGTEDGTITVTVDACVGAGPYEYSIDNWATWQPSNTFTGLAPGVYEVQVKADGCLLERRWVEIIAATFGIGPDACINYAYPPIIADASCEHVIAASVLGNCSTGTGLTYTATPAAISGCGAHTVTLTVSNACGSDSETTTLYINDNEEPEAHCQDITVALSSGQATITPADIDAGSTDNCDITNMNLSQTTFDCDDLNFALDFDGIDDQVSINAPVTGTDEFTIEFWARTPLANPTGDILLLYKNPGRFEIRMDGGRLSVLLPSGSVTQTNYVIPDNVYFHVAVTRDATNTWRVFADGTLRGTFSNTGSIGSTIQLGRWFSSNSFSFLGQMDELSIWDEARPAADIQVDMNNCNLDPATPHLVGYWNMDDGPGSITAVDLTGNGNDGALGNMDSVTDWVNSTAINCNTVTLTIEDCGGNTATCQAQVTVTDTDNFCHNQPPVALCQDITVDADANCEGWATATMVDAGSYDPDGGPGPLTLTLIGIGSGGPYPVGPPSVVTLVVSDGIANDFCLAKVTVKDQTPPTLDCPPSVQALCNGTGAYIPGLQSLVTYSDNCSSSLVFSQVPAAGTEIYGPATATVTVTDGVHTETCTITVDAPCYCSADAGDLLNNASDPSVLQVVAGNDLMSSTGGEVVFDKSYAAADETDPGSYYPHAFILFDENGNIAAYSVLGDADYGNFDFSILSVGTYYVYSLSYDIFNGPFLVDVYLDQVIASSGYGMSDLEEIEADENSMDYCLDLDDGAISGHTNVVVVHGCAYPLDQYDEHLVSDVYDNASATFAIDLDGDGDQDIISSRMLGGCSLDWWENDGSQNFSRIQIDGTCGLRRLYAIDLDGDGDQDILGASESGHAIYWWENDGSQSFTRYNVNDVAIPFFDAQDVRPIDLDQDGDVDVLGAGSNGPTWWENLGAGTSGGLSFTEHSISPAFGFTYNIIASDLDDDGDLDVVASSYAMPGEVAWWENDGSQNYASNYHFIDNYNYSIALQVADVNNDGLKDIISVASFSSNQIVWWENGGGSTPFSSGWNTISSSTPGLKGFVAGKVNADGYIDLVTFGGSNNNITLWKSNGAPSPGFYPETITVNFTGPASVSLVDLDKDGDLDIVGTAFYASKLAWWKTVLYCTGIGSRPVTPNSQPAYETNESLILYPNPAREEAFLSIGDEGAVIRSIRAFNSLGQLVREYTPIPGEPKIRLNLSGFRDGLYTIHIEMENGETVTKRLVVEQ